MELGELDLDIGALLAQLCSAGAVIGRPESAFLLTSGSNGTLTKMPLEPRPRPRRLMDKVAPARGAANSSSPSVGEDAPGL